jgi:threonine/homoserine/homoserine lactone efflux protein
MSLEIWLSFIAASFALCLLPGPSMVLVMGQSICLGRKAVAPSIAGVVAGDAIALICSLVGLGALLATSAVAFNLVKWAGVFYLIYLGIKIWRQSASSHTELVLAVAESKLKLFRNSFLVTSLNPKGLIFFMAFLPLFIRPDAGNTFLQMAILGSSFLCVSLCSVTLYVWFSSRIRQFVSSAHAQRRFGKLSGTVFIGAGLLTAAVER